MSKKRASWLHKRDARARRQRGRRAALAAVATATGSVFAGAYMCESPACFTITSAFQKASAYPLGAGVGSGASTTHGIAGEIAFTTTTTYTGASAGFITEA